MKVYELMSALEKMPCGAEVYCSLAITGDELDNLEILDDGNDRTYGITKSLKEIDCDDNSVSLLT